jgi:hypothetical protein
MKYMFKAFAIVALAGSLAACDQAANVASENLSKAADNFEVARRISVVNGITDKIVMKMEGYCSLQKSPTAGRLAVVCKMEDGKYIKNFLDKSDNVFVLTEQLGTVDVSTFHYRVVFRPQSLIPDVDFQGSGEELITNKNTNG